MANSGVMNIHPDLYEIIDVKGWLSEPLNDEQKMLLTMYPATKVFTDREREGIKAVEGKVIQVLSIIPLFIIKFFPSVMMCRHDDGKESKSSVSIQRYEIFRSSDRPVTVTW